MTFSGTEQLTRSDETQRTRMEVEVGLNIFEPEDDLFGRVEQLHRRKYIPEEIINAYIREALKLADISRLEDGSSYAEIPGFVGVWASHQELDACLRELREVLFDWLVIKIEKGDGDIPVLGTLVQINLNVL